MLSNEQRLTKHEYQRLNFWKLNYEKTKHLNKEAGIQEILDKTQLKQQLNRNDFKLILQLDMKNTIKWCVGIRFNGYIKQQPEGNQQPACN